MRTILRKELGDHFNSIRFGILFCVILIFSVVITIIVSLNIKAELSQGEKDPHYFLRLFTTGGYFSLIWVVALGGPLFGIILGFDSINRERNEGTLSMLLSQPVYRDAIINGKFLAGLTVISVVIVSLVLLISGLGMVFVGVVPTGEQVARLALYAILSVLYMGFWLGLAILSSILFRSTGTAVLAAGAFWIFVAFFATFGAKLVAEVIAPVENPRDPDQLSRNADVAAYVNRSSPVSLYSEAASTLMDPFKKTTKNFILVGRMEAFSISRFNNPLDIPDSVLVVAPYLIAIVALTSICFAVSYLVFMRQEVRSM